MDRVFLRVDVAHEVDDPAVVAVGDAPRLVARRCDVRALFLVPLVSLGDVGGRGRGVGSRSCAVGAVAGGLAVAVGSALRGLGHSVTQVVQGDGEAAVQEGDLAQPLRERVEVEIERIEDLGVGEEDYRRAGAIVAGFHALHVAVRLTARVGLPVEVAVSTHLDEETLGEGVYNRHPHSVKAARDFVALAAELASGVKFRHHDLECRPAELRHDLHRDPTAGIHYPHGGILEDGDLYALASTRQCFVDGVVDDLVDQVVETA